MFQKATKKKSKLRLAIDGPAGSGKTYTALIAATAIADGGKIAVIDTERGSASLYSDKFTFDVLELTTFNPKLYIDAIKEAEDGGYSVVVVDSLSHAWEGEGGALDLVDQASKRSQSGNSYVAWKDVTPLQRALVDSMLQSSCHVIATMRSKMEHVQEKDDRTGKTIIRKVGMAPIQRAGMEYEFTLVGDMDTDHNLIVSKSRCEFVADKVVNKPDHKFFKSILDWLNTGVSTVKETPTKELVETLAPESKAEVKHAVGRPYTPEQLKNKLAEFAKGDCTDKDRQMVAANLELCYAGQNHPEQIRHTVLKYLVGNPSTKTISPGMINAFKRWLNAKQDSGGEWKPDPMSVKEAQSLWVEAQKADGQQEIQFA